MSGIVKRKNDPRIRTRYKDGTKFSGFCYRGEFVCLVFKDDPAYPSTYLYASHGRPECRYVKSGDILLGPWGCDEDRRFVPDTQFLTIRSVRALVKFAMTLQYPDAADRD